jgi:hypothetical protein
MDLIVDREPLVLALVRACQVRAFLLMFTNLAC